MRIIEKNRSHLLALIGSWLYYAFAYGPLVFIPSFLTRNLHTPLDIVSTAYGGVLGGATLVGSLGGGWLADRLSQRDVRWLAWLPAIAFVCAAPLYAIAFSLDNFWTFLTLAFVGYTMLSAGVPATFSAIHAVCGNSRRAVAIAAVYFSATLFGGGLGSYASGLLSDAMSAALGPSGLRYSLIAMTMLLVPSSILFYFFGRAMPRDLEP